MRRRNIYIILLTILFATLLWFSVSLSERYQIHVTAPLIIKSLPEGKAISSNLPRAVTLTFSDYGWRLAKLTLGLNIQWVIDLNTIPAHSAALTLRDIEEQLGGRLGVQPISMTPESLYVRLDVLESKRVAVEPRYTATFRDGYNQIGQTTVRPESVTISGAQSLLEKINRWPTVHQSLNELRQSVDVSVPLADSISSLSFAPDHVALRFDVKQFAEKTFAAVPIELVSVPPNREVILNFSQLEIVVRGGIEQLAHVNQNNIKAIVDYRLILEDTTGFVEPEIVSVPGVHIVKRTPERVQYVVRKNLNVQ